MGIPSLHSWYKWIVFLNHDEILLVLLYTFHYTKNDFVLQNSKFPVYHAHHRRNVIFILKKYAPYALLQKAKKTYYYLMYTKAKMFTIVLKPFKYISVVGRREINWYGCLETVWNNNVTFWPLSQKAEIYLCFEFIRCKRFISIATICIERQILACHKNLLNVTCPSKCQLFLLGSPTPQKKLTKRKKDHSLLVSGK